MFNVCSTLPKTLHNLNGTHYSCLSLYRTPSIPNLWIYRTVLHSDGTVLPGNGTPSIPNLWIYRTIYQGTDGFGIARDNCTCFLWWPVPKGNVLLRDNYTGEFPDDLVRRISRGRPTPITWRPKAENMRFPGKQMLGDFDIKSAAWEMIVASLQQSFITSV